MIWVGIFKLVQEFSFNPLRIVDPPQFAIEFREPDFVPHRGYAEWNIWLIVLRRLFKYSKLV